MQLPGRALGSSSLSCKQSLNVLLLSELSSLSIHVSGGSQESSPGRELVFRACIKLVFCIRGIVNLFSGKSGKEGFSADNYNY